MTITNTMQTFADVMTGQVLPNILSASIVIIVAVLGIAGGVLLVRLGFHWVKSFLAGR